MPLGGTDISPSQTYEAPQYGWSMLGRAAPAPRKETPEHIRPPDPLERTLFAAVDEDVTGVDVAVADLDSHLAVAPNGDTDWQTAAKVGGRRGQRQRGHERTLEAGVHTGKGEGGSGLRIGIVGEIIGEDRGGRHIVTMIAAAEDPRWRCAPRSMRVHAESLWNPKRSPSARQR